MNAQIHGPVKNPRGLTFEAEADEDGAVLRDLFSIFLDVGPAGLAFVLAGARKEIAELKAARGEVKS